MRMITAMLSTAAMSVFSAAAHADINDGGYGHMGNHGAWMMGGSLMMILVIAAIIVLVVLLVRWLGGSASPAAPSGKSALDILAERFARGEIDKQEFEERRRTLTDL